MNLSSRCDYGCRALLELASALKTNEPVASNVIAERRQIPEKYLVHILLQLKRGGLVRSLRGSQGGYLLARQPEEITLLDIVEAIDGPVMHPLPADETSSEELRPIWRELAERISQLMRETTLRDIIEKASTTDMYYI